ncbi:MAG: hypothetical protein IPF93_00565 [Saprospiraceae bacterium]|nr:hypothetical protein [Saprospiraceae bacterium]
MSPAIATKPNHKTLGLSTACESCHTTVPGWAPATFANHNQYYVIAGAHTSIANDCAACHKGVYNGTTPKTCFGCHATDYNTTTKPNHKTANFSTACESCHSQAAWVPASFDHNKTKFPLTGAHISAACTDCHTKGYTGTSTKCVDCHTADFNTATKPNHKTLGLSTACESCHTTVPGWAPATFANHNQYYVIAGAHTSIANDCAACHKGVYNGTTPKTCFGCHATDYNTTTKPNHKTANFSTACESCHSQAAWVPASFDHNKTKFPLTGAHISAACTDCHTKGYTGTSTKCVDCHTADFNTATKPNHKTLGLSTACESCHTTVPGWAPATFANHNQYYVIAGAHTSIANDCAACHKGVYNGTTPKTCFGCHATDYNTTTKPNHKTANFSTACESCHSQAAWVPASFDHNKTKFPLTGAHISAACTDCHTKGYTGTSTKCVDCHTADFNTATKPNHKTLGLSTACESCHTTVPGWAPATFANHNQYYVIAGAHTSIANDCAACHKGVYNGTTPKTCFGCHATDYNTTTKPNHKTANFSTACESCHSQAAWVPASFDHNKTKFPLTGAHISAACTDCHTKGYTGTSTKCVDCHTADFNTATKPNHKTLGLSTACESCHTTVPGWAPATFANHNQYYVIAGAHTSIANDCAACHKGVYNGTTPKTCFGCHATDYNTTTKPNHKTANFSTACESCHSQAAWVPASFDHNKTKFPLTGAHISAACTDCHTKGYTGTSTKCVDCHTADFNTATKPNHKTLGLSTACESCHTTVPGWAPATFANHNQYYVISGAHTSIANDCAACHKGVYNGTTPKTCFGCHATDYNTTSSPNHKTSNFPTACESCHSQAAWVPAAFDHNKTKFPLTGAHLSAACTDCHSKGYTGTSTKCVDCHTKDFNTATNPNHKTLALSTDCASCHTTAPGWAPASFPVHNQYYALSGAHATIANNCATCHKGIYNGTTPKTCIGCHTTDYNTTTNPNHKTANFPVTCESCHSQSAWTPSTFNHDAQYFRIYSGKHRQKWSQCSECHTSASNFSVFSCTNCHEHNSKTKVDNDHKGVKNYIYSPTSCFDCHKKV